LTYQMNTFLTRVNCMDNESPAEYIKKN
jgi:hypothetical protein